jgi:hypothetical protein
MTITIDNIKTWRDWGMVLTPAKDKKPLTKNKVWSADWTEDDLLKADRIAVFHQPEKRNVKGANIMTIDFDCPKFIASAFSSMFPASFSMGKKDSTGAIRPTHIEYEIDPADKPRRKISYEGVIEVLTSTCSIIAGKDRHLIHNVKPLRLSKTQLEHVLETVKVVNFMRELYLKFPEKGNRDEVYLRLAGALTKDTDLSTEMKEKMIDSMCYATKDLEINKRIKKVAYQEKQLEAGQEIAGIKSLCEILNVKNTSPLSKAFDELKPVTVEDQKDKSEPPQGLTTLTLNQFVDRNYPPITYYMYPIISNECLGMIFALPGKGKTLFALELAWRCSQGLDFMDWKFNNMIKPPPVLYVEGEMSATQVQDRVSSMVERDRGLKDFDLDNFYIAVLKEQPNENYQKLKTPEGRLNVQNSADEIYKKTGKKPIIFLDNVRFLMGNFNEKEGQDWIDFVLWLATLRAKGYSTYFLHHAVNTGEKASGSGYQDSNLDVNIKLSQPDENSATDHSSDHFTQIQFEFKKMRENVIGQMTPFIMVVDRNKGSWSKFPVLNKTERKIKSMLDSGKSAKDIINPEKEGMSKANVHKTINKLKGENDGVDKKTSNREAKEVC